MKTSDKNSKALHWLSETDFDTIGDTQAETNQQDEESYLADQKSLLFQLYELEEEDLFI